MQSSSPMQNVPPPKVTGGWKYRPGQQSFIDYVKQDPTRPSFVGRFPTGYGKTEIIAGAYVALRNAGRGNRLLIVVPTATQEDQYAKEFSKKAKRMGLSIKAVVCADRTPRTLKYHRRHEAEVFVTTVQRMEVSLGEKSQSDNWMKELLSTGQWIGAADEYHHYAEQNTWGAAIRDAGISQWIAVSATPTRKVGNTVFGAPAVCVTYEQAFSENPPAVKDVYIKVREYSVSIQDGNGEIKKVTASDLAREAEIEGIDKWEAKRQLRYLQKYCSPILFHAVQELNSIALAAPPDVRPQLLVYAHSCAHAQTLCTILKSVAPGLAVDWAGVGPNGRSDNEEVLARFLDEVDEAGRVTKAHSLDALVQVNVAGEGFDSKPVCVIVDLSLTGLGPMKLQQWGRGTRVYNDIPLRIFVPSDSRMAEFAPLMRGVFDREIDSEDPIPKPQDPPEEPPPPPPLPSLSVIDAMLTGCFDYMPTKEEITGVAPFLAAQINKRDGGNIVLDPANNQADFNTVRDALIQFQKRNETEQSETTRLTFWQDKVKGAVGAVAHTYIWAVNGSKIGVEKSATGDAIRRVHTQWKIMHGGHDSMTAAEFEKKYQWLCEIQKSLRNKDVPSWMTP